ncbi:MobF family relaxase [Mycolicibacterium sp.]|uniref:MobF family relaxase n=1 Tax=Mycolicibacterium sp. TaxID=2320850 RepID=UPI0025DD4EAA|nr:MobF family relaxase [Mycolicibacterium sp.]
MSPNLSNVPTVMDIYKLAAGTGYLYLVRRKTPGRWGGRGLAGLAAGQECFVATDVSGPLWRVEPGSEVTEDQMEALFGRGVHPNAEALTRSLMAQTSRNVAVAATRVGRLFTVDAGENTWRGRLAAAYRDHNLAGGQHKNATIAEPVRTQIQTRIARDIFEEKHGRAPGDERELTGSITGISRKLMASVAGYDLMFVPVKSVAALHALAPLPIAKTIEDCHHRAVNDALDMLQDTAAYTRVGANGAAQIDTEGFIYASFTHRDTRAGDPGLRTHVVVSNKVRACGLDGVWRWHSLDGRPLYAAKVTASELYNTRVEAYLGQELGLGFAERGDADAGKREVREIIGVAPELIVLWSSRRAEINDQYEVLAQEFVTDHGREPATTESIALRRRANLTSSQPDDAGGQTRARAPLTGRAAPAVAYRSGGMPGR